MQFLHDHPTRIGDPTSVVAIAAANGQPYLVKDAHMEGRVKYADRLGISSFIAAPVIAKGKILGVLATSIMSPNRQFTEADLRLATACRTRGSA